MSSQDVIKSVSKKLKYYFEVKRLEDGFDLSGPDCPRLDHPPLKSRPTLMYDGLHDRPLKHYFYPHDVRTVLTQFKTDEGEADIDFDVEPAGKEGREKEVRKFIQREMKNQCYLPSALADNYYTRGKKGRKLKSSVNTIGVPLRKQKPPMKGGYPVLKSTPATHMTLGEAHRIINAASKLLVVTETIDLKKARSKSADNVQQRLPRVRQKSARPKSSKARATPDKQGHSIYTYDPTGKRILLKKGNEDAPAADSAYSTRPGSSSPDSQESDGSVVNIEGQKASAEEVKPWLRKEMQRASVTPDDDDPVVRAPRPPSTEHAPRKSSLRKRSSSQSSYSSVTSTSSSQYSSTTKTSQSEEIAVQTGPELLHDYDPKEDVMTEGEAASYKVNVLTGNRLGASTRADVRIVLVGQNGRSDELFLENSSLHKIPFQKGQEDEFCVNFFDVGPLKSIIIGHDRRDISNGWFVDKVYVQNLKTRMEYYVPCERWLSVNEADGKTFKEFPVNSAVSIKEVELRTPTPTSSYPVYKSPEPPSQPRPSSGVASRSSMQAEQSSRQTSPQRISVSSFTDANKSPKLKTLDEYTAERRGSNSVCKSPRLSRKDEFFDQNFNDKDYSTVIESLSNATEMDNKDDFPSTRPEYTTGEELGTEPILRDVPRNERLSREQKEKSLEEDTARVSTSAVDGQQGYFFMEGFQAGVAASKQAEEKEEKKEVPSGPSIFLAAQTGNLNRIKAIVEHRPEEKTRTDEHGWTPLHLAADNGQIDVVQYLSVSIIDLDVTTPTGFTAMHMAASNGHTSCMKVLSAMGAKIDGTSVDDRTPLHQAALSGHLDAVKWLVANGASVLGTDSSDRTPFDLAMDFQHEDVARFLRLCEEESANPNSSLSQLGTREEEPPRPPTATALRDTDSSSESDEYSSDFEETSPIERKLSQAEQQKHDQELEEKRQMYEKQEREKLRRDSSFLDSIRQQYEEDAL